MISHRRRVEHGPAEHPLAVIRGSANAALAASAILRMRPRDDLIAAGVNMAAFDMERPLRPAPNWLNQLQPDTGRTYPMDGRKMDVLSDRLSLKGLARDAWIDLRDGALHWRLWTHLGLSDIRGRYRRSRLGQHWQTISLAVLVGAISLVYSALLNVDPWVYAVYVVCAFPCWSLMNGIVNESCNVFVSSEGVLRHYSFPKSIFIYQMVARNIVLFMHNVILIVPVFLLAGHGVSFAILFVIPALLVYVINAIWIGIVLGMTCARFRDVPQGVSSAMQIGFMITPVMFMPMSLAAQHHIIIDGNPFARFLAIMRDPLMGQMPSPADYGFVLTITIMGCLLGFFVFTLTRRKLIYWL